MKKLFIAFMLLFTTLSVADIGPVGRSYFQNLDGTAVGGSVEKWYIYVKPDAEAADGTVMVLNTSSDDGYSVTTSSTAGAVPICIMAKEDGSACAANKACRCQTYGLNAGVLFDSTSDNATAGQQAFVSENNAGYIQATTFGSIAASDIPIGVFYDNASASADVELFIKLR